MNSNQYSSLPHTSNGGVGVSNSRGTNYHNNGPNGNNRPYHKKKNNKKHYKNNNNNNNNNGKNQPFNQTFNNQDYGLSSLPHTQTTNNYNPNRYNQYQQFNKFSEDAPDLKSFGNNVPVPSVTKPSGHHRRRRGGGSNNNYRGNGSYNNNNRLNKSLNKDSLDNSLNEISTGMPTSFSLDNLNLKNTNSPSKITNSISFLNASPNKTTLTETILEQEILNVNSNLTNFSSNIDSGVDSNSYCSMPASDSNKNYTPLTAELLSSIEVDEEPSVTKNSSSSMSSSSPESPNQNGYETAISQMASEAEVSFGYDSMSNIDSTINNINVESKFPDQIGLEVVENYLKTSEETPQVPVEVIGENEQDTTASIVSDSSDTGSVKEAEQVLVQNAENTILVEQEKVSEEEIEKVEDQVSETIDEKLNKSMTNLMSQTEKNLSEFDDDKIMAQMKYAEQEVNDLVNKIVLDVISQAIQVTPVESDVPFQMEAPNYMSLEQEISQLEESAQNEEAKCIEDEDISFIDNDNSIVCNKADTSAEVIEGAEEPKVESTNVILNKTEEILSISTEKAAIRNNIAAKEPPVDCFSCTIS